MNGNLAYQEEPRKEMLNGEMYMMPSPSVNHNRVAGNIYYIFRSCLNGEDGIHGAPDLVVEVLSPSTAKNDKGYKKKLDEFYAIPPAAFGITEKEREKGNTCIAVR